MKQILGIATGIIALLIICCFLLAVTGAFSILMPNPPKPKITYGEFPFRLTYELDGEIKVIDDTVICEFDGFMSHGTAGKSRVWKSYLKSGKERVTLLRVENADLTFEITTSYGSPDYYMGDYSTQSKEAYEALMTNDRYLGYIQWQNGIQTSYSILKTEVWEKYKLRIIDIHYSQSIQNSFE